MSPERDGLSPRGRQGQAASADSSGAPTACLGDELLGRAFASAIARARERDVSAPPLDRFAALCVRISRGAAAVASVQPLASVGAEWFSMGSAPVRRLHCLGDHEIEWTDVVLPLLIAAVPSFPVYVS